MEWTDEGTHYSLSINMTGYAPQNVRVQHDTGDDSLVVSGTISNGGSPRNYRTFKHSYELPEDASADDIQANWNQGTLIVLQAYATLHNNWARLQQEANFTEGLGIDRIQTEMATISSSLFFPCQGSVVPSPLQRRQSLSRLRVRASASGLPDNENGLAPEPSIQTFELLLPDNQQLEHADKEHSDNTGTTSRPGLFRTPISGGVQSATLAHRLPDPALAVRNLMEQARFAHLSTIMSRMHHRRRGYPYGSLVDFAPDASGHPIFSLSPLAIHTRNLLADPRCSLLVQNPGWSGLANARVTLFGDVYPLSSDQQEWAHNHFMDKHHQAASQQWRNFDYFRMEVISDIYFIGGFGTVAWVDVKSYEAAQPDIIAKHGSEKILKELNNIFSDRLRSAFSVNSVVDDAAFISIDSQGIDVRVRQGAQYNVQRLSFSEGFLVETIDQAKEALDAVFRKGERIFGNV